MTTYSDHQQRLLDQGASFDRVEAARRPAADETADEVLAILDGLIHNEHQRAKALAGEEVIGKIKDGDEIEADLDVALAKLKALRLTY